SRRDWSSRARRAVGADSVPVRALAVALVPIAAPAGDDVHDIDAADQKVRRVIAIDVAAGERVEPELMTGARAGERADHVPILARVEEDLAAARRACARVEAGEDQVRVVVVVDVARAAPDAEAIAGGLAEEHPEPVAGAPREHVRLAGRGADLG